MARVWRLGDNVNTDQIIPGRYNVTTDRAQLAKYCLCEHRPDFAEQVAAGDVVVAGRNFGCGSSREHAAVALKATGIAAVVAVSFARIFYRNAINIGLPVFIAPAAVALEDGEQVEIDTSAGAIRDLTHDRAFQADPLPEFVQRIVEAGGIVPLVRRYGRLTPGTGLSGSAPLAPDRVVRPLRVVRPPRVARPRLPDSGDSAPLR